MQGTSSYTNKYTFTGIQVQPAGEENLPFRTTLAVIDCECTYSLHASAPSPASGLCDERDATDSR